MCVADNWFCYDAHYLAKCQSDGTGISGLKEYCDYGCKANSSGNAFCNDLSYGDISVPGVYYSFAGGVPGCYVPDLGWEPMGACFQFKPGYYGKCTISGTSIYILPDPDCCPSNYAIAPDGRCGPGCVGASTGSYYDIGDYASWTECNGTTTYNCESWIYGDVSAFNNKYCHFNTQTQCICNGESSSKHWTRTGTGCHPLDSSGAFKCDTGWTSNGSDPDTTDTSAMAICKPCSNSQEICYKCKAAKAVQNGVCDDRGATCETPTNPDTNLLCDSGTLQWTDSTGDGGFFNWNCNGVDGQDGNCKKLVATDVGCSSVHKADIDGICGSSNGGIFVSAPTSNLCSSGIGISWIDDIATDDTFNWYCKDQCSGTPSYCSAERNFPPSIDNVIIKDSVDKTIVGIDTDGMNHICQTEFHNSREIIFEVTISDADGVVDVDNANITLTWNGYIIPMISVVSTDATHKIATFELDFPDSYNSATVYPLIAKVTDSRSQTDTDSSRNFKVWNCQVPINDSNIYDDSLETGGCANAALFVDVNKIKDIVGFDDPMSFVPLLGDSKNMIVTKPSMFKSGNNLIWGLQYPVTKISFNPEIKINKASLDMRLNNGSCATEINLTNNNQVSPYSANPSVTADLSAIVNQEPWWQASNGGVISNQQISNQVPSTCDTDCKISLNALAAAPDIQNTPSSVIFQDWSYLGKLVEISNNYSYFYDQYFVKNGVGTVINSSTTINSISKLGSDSNNTYFIKGNLIIDGDILLGTQKFLMIVVSGDITVTDKVSQVDGILVANNISAGGKSLNQLNFNGSLYAANNISFSRGYLDIPNITSKNNISPAVKVNFKPELLFNLPGSVAKVLSSWQWGN